MRTKRPKPDNTARAKLRISSVTQSIDEAIPENLQPLRKTIVGAAIELADQLVTEQYGLHRSIVRSADRALTK